MVIEQRVTVHLFEKDGSDKLGDLVISSEISGDLESRSRGSLEDFKTEKMEFRNIPRVNDPDNETPIQYCTKKYLGPGARIMLLEENSYQIRFDSEYEINEKKGDLVFPTLHREEDVILKRWRLDEEDKRTIRATLNFHSYVGKSFIDMIIDGKKSSPHPFEVRSKKIGYQDQYPAMIGDLSEAAAGLIFEKSAPLYQEFDFDERSRETHYEDFMFLEYIFGNDELPQAYEYIMNHMYDTLERKEEKRPIAFASSIGAKELVNIVSNPEYLNKTDSPPPHWPEAMDNHVPSSMMSHRAHETIDVPENRLLKSLLLSIDAIVSKLLRSSIGLKEGYIKDKLKTYNDMIQEYLSHDWLKEVDELRYVPSNSQVLQKREGYRDIFKYFINFNFAFRLQWEDIRSCLRGYNRQLSELYEYWCYFKLIDVMEDITGAHVDYRNMFETRKWSIRMKRGNQSKIPFSMVVDDKHWDMVLMYNRTFSKHTKEPSYSLPFRPDYTLFISDGDEKHFVHFDAKYRSKGEIIEFYNRIGSEKIREDKDRVREDEKEVITRDEEENTRKTYKNADIYKMHTYKDAILKTQGAYILYPGDKNAVFRVNDDEAVPSVGAFPLTPGADGKEEDSLESFLLAILKKLSM